MIFTGENKKAFEKWYIGIYQGSTKTHMKSIGAKHRIDNLYKSKPHEMCGVYLYYLDSIEVFILIDKQFDLDFYDYSIDDGSTFFESNKFKWTTRIEVLAEAFKMADKLINEQ